MRAMPLQPIRRRSSPRFVVRSVNSWSGAPVQR